MEAKTSPTHRTVELRSIEMHRLIAERLDHEILRRAEAVLNSRAESDRRAGRAVDPYTVAWQNLLRQPYSEIVSRLVEDSEQMRDLRQNTPFAGVISPRERWDVIRSVQ